MIVRTARDLGSAVRDARLRRGWTQAELANRIDTSRQWVIAFERGKATAEVGPVLRAITALGAVLDVVPKPSTEGLINLDELLDDQP
jgi:HTH-type transcriptional regulator / antitoxin HipB